MKKLTFAIVMGLFALLHFAQTQNATAAGIPEQTITAKKINAATLNDVSAAQNYLSATPPFTATYRLTFTATWSQATHPHPNGSGDFPGNAHFSRMIGGVHTNTITFWQAGGMASTGIENMAEQGIVTDLTNEVTAAINNTPPTALSVLGGGSSHDIASSPGSATINSFSVNRDFPLITLVSMIAPSPDWFVGVSGLPLFENGHWVLSKTVPLYPYDAGTEDGTDYLLSNPATSPQQPIANITGVSPFSSNDLGTFTITRINYSELSLHKSVAPETNVSPQELITYTLVISNSGDTDATGTIVTDTLPAGASFAGWVQQPAGANESGNQITWTGSVTAGKAITFTYAATYTGAAYGETITNTAYYSHTSGSGQSEAGFTVQEAPPLLSIGKSGPASASVNSPFTYTLTLTNSGTLSATNLVITDALPAGTTFVNATNGGGLQAGNIVQWDVNALPGSGAMAQVSFAVTAATTGTVVNQNYGVAADGNISVTGSRWITTSVGSDSTTVHLPLILKN